MDNVFVPLLSICWRVATGPGAGLEVRQGVGKEGRHRVLHEGVPQGAGQLQNGGPACRFHDNIFIAHREMNFVLNMFICKPRPFFTPAHYDVPSNVLRLDSACCIGDRRG